MSSSSSTTTSTDYVKPLAAALTATVLDKFVLQNPNMMSSAYFGASVGAALFAVKMVEVNVPKFMPDIASIGASGQTLSNRVAEIGGGRWFVIRNFQVRRKGYIESAGDYEEDGRGGCRRFGG